MKIWTAALLSAALLACGEPAKSPSAPTPADEVEPPSSATEAPSKPTPPPATVRPAPGTRTTLAEKTVDDSWDKMIVAGGRLYVLTDVNKWTTGPMYVPAARLWSVPITGGELTRHLELEGLSSMAADERSLYVAVNRDLSTMDTSRAKSPTGRIFRLPLAGGAPTDLATGISPSNIALDGDTIWFDGFRMPKDGSQPPAPSGVKGAIAFAFDAENVYFTTGKGSAQPAKPGGKNGRLLRMAKSGGAPVVFATGLPDEPSGLAVDATHVYVTAVAWGSEATEKAGVVARVAKEGGDLEVLAGDVPMPRAAWLSADHVYLRSGRPGRPGAVLRVAKTGGAVETVVSDGTLAHVTMDESSIYFSNDGTFQKEPFARLTPAVLVRLVK